MQGGVFLEDLPVQLSQPRSRLDAELVGRPDPGRPVLAQRFGGATRPVQRQHQVGANPFVEGVSGGAGGRLGQQRGVLAQPQADRAVWSSSVPRRCRFSPSWIVASHRGFQRGERLAPPQRRSLGEQRTGPLVLTGGAGLVDLHERVV